MSLHGRWEYAKFTVFMARRRLTPLDKLLDASGGVDEEEEEPKVRCSKIDIYDN